VGAWRTEGGDRGAARLAVAASGACAFALGSLLVGAAAPWLAVLLAVAAVVAFRLARA
jgi:hypothetical protein